MAEDKEGLLQKLEDDLVRALCERNGWEYGGNEDYDIAVEDVKWFLSKLLNAGYRKINPNGCEYWGQCKDDPQSADYCPRTGYLSPEEVEAKLQESNKGYSQAYNNLRDGLNKHYLAKIEEAKRMERKIIGEWLHKEIYTSTPQSKERGY